MIFGIVLTLWSSLSSCVATSAVIFGWLTVPHVDISQMSSCGRSWTGVWTSWNSAWRHRNPLQSRVSTEVKRSFLWGEHWQECRGSREPWPVLFLPGTAEEALRAIRTLRSDKAPLAKKRQLMRAMFGDYRKKMQEEQCRELKLMETGGRTFAWWGGEERGSVLPCALQAWASLYEMTENLLFFFSSL